MRLRLVIAFAICLLSLSGCSRESSISENVNLRNNHSVVFASRTPFKNPQAFADSILSLSNPDSVIAHDTITVTVNDTIYLMGFLKYNADKIYRYAWFFKNPDSTIVSKNATQVKWVFPKPSGKGINCPAANSKLFCPLFIAVDGNNARDTAGSDQFIRVIDTPPYLSVPKDTLWTRSKSDITFPIVARDSFGTVEKVKVDLDASGKSKPKDWNVTKVEGTDSMFITVTYDSTRIDSLGNQKIYVIVVDDDDNETLDSVNLHFNQPPTLELLAPTDNARKGFDERFAFFYKAKDVDNPASLRYFIRVAKSRDNYGTPPVLTDNDLIAREIKDKSYEPIAAEFNDSNIIVTLKNPKAILSGNLFWDVWVTDGYDTVFSERIKDKDGTLRPWKFFHGNLKDTTGKFEGYVKYEGWSHHSGIRIVFQDSLGNRSYTRTNDNGFFSIFVKSGTYEMLAMDTTGYGFKDTVLHDLFVDVSSEKILPNIVLKDTADPVIIFSDKPNDTISDASIVLNGKFYDHGSQVKSAVATLDGDTIKFSSFSQNTWVVNLDSMEDGAHKFYIAATDSAGRTADSTISFYVHATTIHITVNNQAAVYQENSQSLTFIADVSKTSIADSLIWVTNVPKYKTVSHKIKNFADTLKYANSDAVGSMTNGVLYEMYAMTPSGVKSNVVRFGVLGTDPVIYFQKPSNDTVISINDKITFSVFSYLGEKGDATPSIKLVGDGSNRNFNTGFKTAPDEEDIYWSKAGDKKIIVTLTSPKVTVSDTLRVKVVEDPPTIKILNKQNDTRQKINSKNDVEVKAFDKFGEITAIKWACGTNPTSFSNSTTITAADTVTTTLTFTMPKTATNGYKCIVQATDDDNMVSYDTISYNVIEGRPYLLLDTQQATVKINSLVSFNGIGIDSMGTLIDRKFYCDSIKKNLGSVSEANWTHISKLDTSVKVPNVPCTWYCLVKIMDDDSLVAADTATYTVLLDPPWVKVSEDYKSVTIKDTVALDAQYGDDMGRIVKYEWGCAPKGSAISYTWSSTKTPRYNAVMPSSEETDFRCVVRVTDDDSLTATDTTHIDVATAPPMVVVKDDELTTNPNFKIKLDVSEAKDADNYDGEIVKREWSCARSYDINNNWKTVSTFDTSWKAPTTPSADYICVARVTDDDGNQAMDTVKINFTSEFPTLNVVNPLIHVNVGESFDLDARINAWQGVEWYYWQCFDQNGKAMESYKKWSYKGSLYDVRLDTTSYIKDPTKLDNTDTLFCVINALESSSDSIFRDTTIVKIVRQHPKGVISAADTVYLWSGDKTVDEAATSFFTKEWGGYNSQPGELGDPAKKYQYRWRFSTVSSSFYLGDSDGHLDTSSYEFVKAFKRPSREGSMVISLDFRDSIPDGSATQSFFARHTGDTVSRTIYFRKAWQNLAPSNDTVLAYSKYSTAPALTVLKEKPIVAYLKTNTSLESSYLSGSTWKSLSTSAISVTDSITKIQLCNDGSSAYMAILTAGKKLSVYQSSGGTSSWGKVGNDISSDTSFSLIVQNSTPIVLYLNGSDKTPYFAKLSGSSWTSKQISQKPSRSITGAFVKNGGWATVYVTTESKYKGLYALYDSSNEPEILDAAVADSINAVHMSVDATTGDAYLSFLSRKVEDYGPFVYKGTVASGSISWKKDGMFKSSIALGRQPARIQVAAQKGKTYVIFDDNNKYSGAQSHVFQMGTSSWLLYGENELPYFKSEFYSSGKNYYLRGALPNIAISEKGDVYISMLAWENPTASGKNFGPIIMKYRAKNWTVNDK